MVVPQTTKLQFLVARTWNKFLVLCLNLSVYRPICNHQAEARKFRGDGDEKFGVNQFWWICLQPVDNFATFLDFSFLFLIFLSYFSSSSEFYKYTYKGFMVVRRTTASVFLVVRLLFLLSQAHGQSKCKRWYTRMRDCPQFTCFTCGYVWVWKPYSTRDLLNLQNCLIYLQC